MGSECKFWSDVKKQWVHRFGSDGVRAYVQLQKYFEHYRHYSLLFAERKNQIKSIRFKAYAKYTRTLLEAIYDVSGKRIIVDSSKNPVRALALSIIPDIDLRFVHLVRDGRGVAWSLKKKKGKAAKGRAKLVYASPLLQSLNWFLVNLSSEYVLLKSSAQRIRVRYEDLVDQPKLLLNQIGDLFGTELGGIADDLLAGKEMKIGHMISGNRIRLNRSIHLHPDYEWKEQLPKKDQKIFWLFAGKLARKYGYFLN